MYKLVDESLPSTKKRKYTQQALKHFFTRAPAALPTVEPYVDHVDVVDVDADAVEQVLSASRAENTGLSNELLQGYVRDEFGPLVPPIELCSCIQVPSSASLSPASAALPTISLPAPPSSASSPPTIPAPASPSSLLSIMPSGASPSTVSIVSIMPSGASPSTVSIASTMPSGASSSTVSIVSTMPSGASSSSSVPPSSDIGYAIKNVLSGNNVTVNELRSCLQSHWKPTCRDELPFSMKKGVRRYLGLQHFSSFPWLAVSYVTEFKGAWCVWCSLLTVTKTAGGHHNSGGQVLGTLVQKPLTKFHKLTGKDGDLSVHSKAAYPLRCQEQATEFLQRSLPGVCKDVRTLQDSSRQRAIEENRRALAPIVETILLCARQNIALRGHRDSGPLVSMEDTPVNEGNFRALLRYRMRGGDKPLREHVMHGARNAQYISPEVQNAILDAASQVTQQRLIKDINAAPCWSLLCDETTDRMKREQLCIAARYVTFLDGKVVIKEDPICLIDAIEEICGHDDTIEKATDVRLTGVNLGKIIQTKCNSLGLNLSVCVGQGMDGAANMSSEMKGAASELRKSAPMALYFHCMLHCFNLCASQSVRVTMVRSCLDTVQEMVTFFRYSAKRQHALQTTIDASTESDKPKTSRLKKACETRFVERHSSISTALELLPYVHQVLDHFSASESRETRQASSVLMNSIEKFPFIVSLQSLSEVSALLIGVSRQLQSPNRDIIKALSYINDRVDIISTMRVNADESFRSIFGRAKVLAGNMEVPLERPRVPKRSVYRANAGVTAEGDITEHSIEEYYKINLYVPLLDGLLSHLRDRFGPTQKKALALGYLVPAYIGQEFSDIAPAIEFYGTFLTSEEELRAEFTIWRHRWINSAEAKDVNTAAAALEHCPALTMPNVHILLYILATLPVTTAEPERVFSKVEKTASCVRSMGEERLEALILLQSHLDRTPSVGDVIDYFATSTARRINLIL